MGGYTPFTATDYPGKLAAVVFVQGCPWRCGYCHNPHLQPRTVESALLWTALRETLKRRIGLIDAVVFSGGEPTADPFLLEAILDVRELGFGIGLHTGGAYSKRLKEVLPHVDWVGFDIKTNPEQYDDLTQSAHSGEQAFLGAEAVLASGASYEFRTTIHPSLHSPDDILRLGQRIAAMGCEHYALQLFREQGCADTALTGLRIVDYPGQPALAELQRLFPNFVFRSH
ncbi:MAG: anaerobic ribonucleoside-triphosphate reductase activating protein [Burkholderiaceae bacterium]